MCRYKSHHAPYCAKSGKCVDFKKYSAKEGSYHFFVATFVILDACFVSFAASIQAKFYKILCCATKVQIFTNIIIMSRKKYEYRVENINDDNMGFYDFIYEVERILNKHGENGWELDKMENYGGRTLLILRREIG